VEQAVQESVGRLRDHVSKLEERRRTLTSRSVVPSNSCHQFYSRRSKSVRKVREGVVISVSTGVHSVKWKCRKE